MGCIPREGGYYWVKVLPPHTEAEIWQVWEWTPSGWRYSGDDAVYTPIVVYVNENKLQPPICTYRCDVVVNYDGSIIVHGIPEGSYTFNPKTGEIKFNEADNSSSIP